VDLWRRTGQSLRTIVKGQPKGMPAWGGRIPEYQIWQIMAFIQSMNGQQPTSAKEEYSCAREG